VLVLLETQFNKEFQALLAAIAGPSATEQAIVKAALFCGFLTILTFISYQGITISFMGTGQSNVFGLGAGLLNGYLYAGSLWYYLHNAGWPFLVVKEPFSNFYNFALALLPPNVFKWPYLIALVAFMLIMRVWK